MLQAAITAGNAAQAQQIVNNLIGGSKIGGHRQHYRKK
jgi:hypothetical protein